MYKDKDKQREANRAIQAKRRAKGVTKGVTAKGVTERVLPKRKDLGLHQDGIVVIFDEDITKKGVTDKALPERTGVNLKALNIAAVPNG